VQPPGKDPFGDDTRKEARPETPPLGHRGELARGAVAETLGKPGEVTEGRGQHRLDARPHVTREHRGYALARYRDGQRGTVDDRRREEIAKLGPVDHIDRHPGLL